MRGTGSGGVALLWLGLGSIDPGLHHSWILRSMIGIPLRCLLWSAAAGWLLSFPASLAPDDGCAAGSRCCAWLMEQQAPVQAAGRRLETSPCHDNNDVLGAMSHLLLLSGESGVAMALEFSLPLHLQKISSQCRSRAPIWALGNDQRRPWIVRTHARGTDGKLEGACGKLEGDYLLVHLKQGRASSGAQLLIFRCGLTRQPRP